MGRVTPRTEAPTPWGPLELPAGGRAGDGPLLDAALDVFSEVGIRAATMQAIATRAGVSRVWLYKRLGDRDALVRAVLAREVGRLIERVVEASVSTGGAEEQLTRAITTSVAFLRDHALLRRLLEAEPSVALPFLTTCAGDLYLGAIDWATESIVRLAGLARPHATLVAEVLVRFLASSILTPESRVASSPAELEGQVQHLVHRLLVPLRELPSTARHGRG